MALKIVVEVFSTKVRTRVRMCRWQRLLDIIDDINALLISDEKRNLIRGHDKFCLNIKDITKKQNLPPQQLVLNRHPGLPHQLEIYVTEYIKIMR